MQCERIREAASARLDGEPISLPSAVLDEHLSTCRACAAWLSDATRLTRGVRLGRADVPDLSASILAAAVLPVRRGRRVLLLRALLVLAGLLTIGLALPDLFGMSIDMQMSTHSAHESGAFNIAVGIGLLTVARRPRYAGALLPMIGVLVALLTILGTRDVLDGAVAFGRLATHLCTVAGLIMLFALHRAEPDEPPYGRRADDGRRTGDGRRTDDGYLDENDDAADDLPGIRGVA